MQDALGFGIIALLTVVLLRLIYEISNESTQAEQQGESAPPPLSATCPDDSAELERKEHEEMRRRAEEEEERQHLHNLRVVEESRRKELQRQEEEEEARRMEEEHQRISLTSQLTALKQRREQLLSRSTEDIWNQHQPIDDIVLMFSFIDIATLTYIKPDILQAAASGEIVIGSDFHKCGLFTVIDLDHIHAEDREFAVAAAVRLGMKMHQVIMLSELVSACVFWIRYRTDNEKMITHGDPFILYSREPTLIREMQRDYVRGTFGEYEHLPYHGLQKRELEIYFKLEAERPKRRRSGPLSAEDLLSDLDD